MAGAVGDSTINIVVVIIIIIQGSFREGTLWNAVPIVKVFKNAALDRSANHFSAHYIAAAGLCIYHLKNFPWGNTPGPTLKRSLGVWGADTNFRLTRQRSHCSCFTKRPLSLLQ